MLSLNKLPNGNSSYAYVVACQLPDGNDHHIVKSRKFESNGLDDLEAHASAVRFAKATDTVPEFRAFLFGEPDGSGRDDKRRVEFVVDKTAGSRPALGHCQTVSDKIRVRSYVCMREKQLTGIRYAVAMCRLESGQLRSISFLRGMSAEEEADARGEDEVLGKAVQFLRSVAFENWRRQVPKESMSRSREQAAGSYGNPGKERGLKHLQSFVEIEQGEKVDCVCGKNRSHGLMMACGRCDAWEHAECQGFRSKQQIPVDYICSACKRAEREEVTVIRCEEQGKYWSVDLEGNFTGMTCMEEQDHSSAVCCLCGCEDNEGYENLVQPCSCDGCSSRAHPNCITMAKVGASLSEQRLQKLGLCYFCGSSGRDGASNDIKLQKAGRWMEESHSTGAKPVKGDQYAVARKRLRSTTVGGAVPVKVESGDKMSTKSSRNERGPQAVQPDKAQPEASPTELKSSSPFLGRRFSDAAANVPIKKRRIQLEMQRSPSPPPGNSKVQPDSSAVHDILEITKANDPQRLEGANAGMMIEVDDHGGASHEFFSVGHVQKCETGLPCAALDNSEDEQTRGAGDGNNAVLSNRASPQIETTGLSRTSFGRRPDVLISTQRDQLSQLDSFVENKIEKVEAESQQCKKSKCVSENGVTSAGSRLEEENSCLESQVRVQQQQSSPAQAGGSLPNREDGQACDLEVKSISEHLTGSGLSRMGDAGVQSREVAGDSVGEERPLISEIKYREDDVGHPVGDHFEVEGKFGKLRPATMDGNVSAQTCVTTEEHIGLLGQHEDSNVQTSTVVEKSNSMLDDRLHWDLNMDMEEWGRPSEEITALTTGQDLSVVEKIEVEKSGFSQVKEVARDVDKGELDAVVIASTVGNDRSLEPSRLLHDNEDAARMSSFTGDSGSSSKPVMQIEEMDESSSMLIGSYDASLKQADTQIITTPQEISPSGGAVVIHVKEQLGLTEDESGLDSSTLFGDRSGTELQEQNSYRGSSMPSARYEEARVLRTEEPSSVVEAFVDKETKGAVSLVADKDRSNVDCSSSQPTNTRAVTSCVYKRENICGTCSEEELMERSNEAADVLPSAIQPGDCDEILSRIQHPKEGASTASAELAGSSPTAKTDLVRDVRGPGFNEDEGAAFEYDKAVDKEVVEEFVRDRRESSTSPPRQVTAYKWEGDNVEDLEAEDVDYGDSDMREGDEIEAEERSQRGGSEVESNRNSLDELKTSNIYSASLSQGRRGETDGSNMMVTPGLSKKRRHQSGMTSAGEAHNTHGKEAHIVQVEDPDREALSEKVIPSAEVNGSFGVEDVRLEDEHGNGSVSIATFDSHRTSLERKEDLIGTAGSGKAVRKSEVWREPSERFSRVKISGWDQLPEGFETAKEALQASRSNAGHAGWGSHYGPGFSGWNVSPSTPFGSSDSRYGPGHGRGMVFGNGPAADGVAFEKRAWSRSDPPRRSRVDDGLDAHVRVPVIQELRQSSGSRVRSSSLESVQRQRRRGAWADDPGAAPSLWSFGPGRHLAASGPSREPFGFHPHKTRNAAAVAAAKVESSGLVVAPDGTVIKAGAAAQVPLRGLAGKGRGGGFSSMGDMSPNGAVTGVGNTGLGHSMRIGGDVDLRGREILGVDTRVAAGISMGAQSADAPLRYKGVGERFSASFPPGVGSPIVGSTSGMLGTSSRFRWSREEQSFPAPVEQEDRTFPGKRRPLDSSVSQPRSKSRLSTPPRPVTNNDVIAEDGAASQPRKSRGTHITDLKAEVDPEVDPEELESSSHQVVPPPPKLPLPPPPPREKRSPPAGLKRLITKREVDWPRGRERSRDKEREWDRERVGSRGHYSPSRRSSPHVIHGSALTDERDRQLLAGIDRSRDQGASLPTSTQETSIHRGRSSEGVHEARKPTHHDGRKQEADNHIMKGEELLVKPRAQSKEVTSRGGDTKESRSETDLKAGRASGTKIHSGNRTDIRRDSQKSGSSYKHSSSREGEDDVAPRRRRPS